MAKRSKGERMSNTFLSSITLFKFRFSPLRQLGVRKLVRDFSDLKAFAFDLERPLTTSHDLLVVRENQKSLGLLFGGDFLSF